MAKRPEQRVQRELNFAIVDEVDSILIDEARTPLIISGRPEKSTDLYVKVDDAVRRLRPEKHYEIEEKGHHVLLTEEGMEMAEKLLDVENLYSDDTIGMVHMLEQSLKAHNFFRRDKEYMVAGEGEVLIVDEFTGRAMEGRRYSDGLHQAIEAKERVPIRFESQTIASITYQNYFRLYDKLAGMTGTAITEAVEFSKIYNLDVFKIPTNLPLIREDLNDLIFATEHGKFRYLCREIRDINEEGRPILVGTVSIEKSELVAEMLREEGVEELQLLNAKHHEREASIVANAGKRGAITIATNMAGRGTDIKLAEGIREVGGLCIFGTERHESRRIDNQLRGRCGRQGDPGTTRFFVSLEDEVARLFGGDRVKRLLNMFGGENEMDDQPLSQRMVSRSIERAQRQVEEYNFEIRKHLLEYDEVMDRQRKYIYTMRNEVLEDHDIREQIETMFENIILDALDEYAPEDVLPDEWDLDGLSTALRSFFGMDLDTRGESDETPKTLRESLFDQILAEYQRRHEAMAGEIRRLFRDQAGGDDSDIDFDQMARKRIHDLELMVLLRTVDEKWIEHLYTMDYLRDSVRLRAFGQRDPLLEYKQEGYELFQDMVRSIEENVVQMLFRITDPEQRKRHAAARQFGRRTADEEDPFDQLREYSYVGADKEADSSFAAFDTARFNLAGQSAEAQSRQAGPANAEKRPKQQPRRVEKKVGPNDPCPCGSGKKYKKCCGGVQ
jgi:preprotein translocase subunit SecA